MVQNWSFYYFHFPITDMAYSNSVHYSMASFLIIEHQISQQIEANDVMAHLRNYDVITLDDERFIREGVTKKIRADRLLAKIKCYGAEGYIHLRSALLHNGMRYNGLVASMDKIMPPRDLLTYSASTTLY